jgi:hypothetical protein
VARAAALAWSDLNLAVIDPAIAATLTHLPDARTTARLVATVATLAVGFALRGGVAVGAVAMIGGSVVEAALLAIIASRSGVTRVHDAEAPRTCPATSAASRATTGRSPARCS